MATHNGNLSRQGSGLVSRWQVLSLPGINTCRLSLERGSHSRTFGRIVAQLLPKADNLRFTCTYHFSPVVDNARCSATGEFTAEWPQMYKRLNHQQIASLCFWVVGKKKVVLLQLHRLNHLDCDLFLPYGVVGHAGGRHFSHAFRDNGPHFFGRWHFHSGPNHLCFGGSQRPGRHGCLQFGGQQHLRRRSRVSSHHGGLTVLV